MERTSSLGTIGRFRTIGPSAASLLSGMMGNSEDAIAAGEAAMRRSTCRGAPAVPIELLFARPAGCGICSWSDKGFCRPG